MRPIRPGLNASDLQGTALLHSVKRMEQQEPLKLFPRYPLDSYPNGEFIRMGRSHVRRGNVEKSNVPEYAGKARNMFMLPFGYIPNTPTLFESDWWRREVLGK